MKNTESAHLGKPVGDRAKPVSRICLWKWFVVFTILAISSIGLGRKDSDSRRRVIISTDDAGMCSSVNKGTFAALRANVVKSASIMTCCPGFDEFAEFARSNPQYDYGVHLTLTCDMRPEGWGPVRPKAEVRSLIDANGWLHASVNEVARLAKVSEVESELRSQIRKALDAGIVISHLDHHMWVMLARPDLLRIYVQLGKEFNIPVRLARTPPPTMLAYYGRETAAVYEEQLTLLDQGGFPIVDFIEAENYSIPEADKRIYFIKLLRNLNPGITEIIVHCAVPDDSAIDPPDHTARFVDTTIVCSPEFLHETRQLQIELLNWRTLSQYYQPTLHNMRDR